MNQDIFLELEIKTILYWNSTNLNRYRFKFECEYKSCSDIVRAEDFALTFPIVLSLVNLLMIAKN